MIRSCCEGVEGVLKLPTVALYILEVVAVYRAGKLVRVGSLMGYKCMSYQCEEEKERMACRN